MNTDLKKLAGLVERLEGPLSTTDTQKLRQHFTSFLENYLFTYSSGEVEILPLEHKVRVNDQTTRLSPKLFVVLCAFLRRPMEIVTDEELRRTAGSDAANSSNWASVVVSKLRAEVPQLQQCFEVVKGNRRAYRFNPAKIQP